MIPAAESVLNVTERVLFLALLATVGAFALRTYVRRLVLIFHGRRPAKGDEGVTAALKRFLVYVPGQWSNIRTISAKDLGGAQHLVLFWSALCIALYYLVFLVLGEGFELFAQARETYAAHLFLSVVEVLALLLLVALAWGVIRRTRVKPARLGPDFEEKLFLGITLGASLLFLCFFCLGGLRLNLGMTSHVGPVTGAVAQVLQVVIGGQGAQEGLFHVIWWAQAGLMACFMVYIPYSDHQHAVFAPLNILASHSQPAGRFAPATMDHSYLGLTGLEDFTWKQLLELYGCVQCGRCQQACPAQAAGKDLSPKKVVQDLRVWMDDTGKIKPFWKKGAKDGAPKSPEPAGRVSDGELWACTTCMACVEACPAFVSALDKIVDLRRDRVLAKSNFYPEVTTLFRDLENFEDIFGKGKATREDWALGRNIKVLDEGTETDTLFWVGCQASFHDRGKDSAIKLAEILTRCGVDLAILGKAESCCGDPFRRLGNEYQYQNFVRKNIETFKKLSFKRIVTYCPHCYNTLKNEYPQMGGEFEVVHYTELFDTLIQQGALTMKAPASAKVAYHDPCYLARGNDLVKGSEVLSALPGAETLPLENSGKQTFCCGGGGGAMWMRESGGAKINELRVQQLVTDEPEVIATSCPYCVVMLEDGIKSLGLEQVQCKDLIELVHETV